MQLFIELNLMSVKSLKTICREQGFSGFSKLNKQSLIELIIGPIYQKLMKSPKPLELYTVKDLKSLCREKHIKGYSNKKKAELIKLIDLNESSPNDLEVNQINTSEIDTSEFITSIKTLLALASKQLSVVSAKNQIAIKAIGQQIQFYVNNSTSMGYFIVPCANQMLSNQTYLINGELLKKILVLIEKQSPSVSLVGNDTELTIVSEQSCKSLTLTKSQFYPEITDEYNCSVEISKESLSNCLHVFKSHEELHDERSILSAVHITHQSVRGFNKIFSISSSFDNAITIDGTLYVTPQDLNILTNYGSDRIILLVGAKTIQAKIGNVIFTTKLAERDSEDITDEAIDKFWNHVIANDADIRHKVSVKRLINALKIYEDNSKKENLKNATISFSENNIDIEVEKSDLFQISLASITDDTTDATISINLLALRQALKSYQEEMIELSVKQLDDGKNILLLSNSSQLQTAIACG